MMHIYLIYLVLLRPLVYLIENILFSWNIASNLGAGYMIIFVVMYFVFCFKELKTNEKIISTLIISFTLIVMLFTEFSLNILNNTLRFNCILIMLFLFAKPEIVSDFKKILDKYLNYIIAFSVLSLSFIVLSYVTKSGLVKVWGGSNYLQGPFKSPHDLAYYLIIIYSITTYCKFKLDKPYLYLLNLVPLALSFATGARVPFLIILLIAGINLVYDYKRKPKIIILFMTIMLIVLIVLSSMGVIRNIPMINKFIVKIQKNDFISGRDYLWLSNIEEYFRYNGINKLFGKGINYSYSFNYSKYKMAIWSHNDFIHIVLSYGITGLAIYISAIGYFVKRNKSIIIALMLLFIAFFNGLFTYYNFVLGLPFVFVLKDYMYDILKWGKRCKNED